MPQSLCRFQTRKTSADDDDLGHAEGYEGEVDVTRCWDLPTYHCTCCTKVLSRTANWYSMMPRLCPMALG
jgi:hypothetical protein